MFLEGLAVELVAAVLILIASALLSWAIWSARIAKVGQFFGTGQQRRITVHLSLLKCEGLRTGKAIAVEEYEAANEFRKELGWQQYVTLFFLIRVFGFDPGELKIVVESSPPAGAASEELLGSGSHILVGGPECNPLTAHYLSHDRARVKFDTDRNQFLVCSDGNASPRRVDRYNLALLEKLVVNGRTIIIAFGDGESETREAVRYLAHRWKELLSAVENTDGEFALLWSVKTGEEEERIGLVDDNNA